MKFCQPSCQVMGGTGAAHWSRSARLLRFRVDACTWGGYSGLATLVHKCTQYFCSQTDCAVSLQMLHFTKTSKITALELELLWQQVIRGFFFQCLWAYWGYDGGWFHNQSPARWYFMFKPIGDIYRVITDVFVCLVAAFADCLLHIVL